MIVRVRFKVETFRVETCERSKARPRDWREEWVSVDVEADGEAHAVEKFQTRVQQLMEDELE